MSNSIDEAAVKRAVKNRLYVFHKQHTMQYSQSKKILPEQCEYPECKSMRMVVYGTPRRK